MDRPANSQTGRKCVFGNPNISSPLSQALCALTKTKEYILSCILLLLFASCPHTVGWLIIAVVVLAFQAHSFWSQTHVFVEILKLLPLFTNSNSPTSVILKRFSCFACASLDHIHPRPMLLGFAQAVGDRTFNSFFQTVAPARYVWPPQKRGILNRPPFSAVAPNIKQLRGVALTGESSNKQPSKTKPYAGDGKFTRIGINHDASFHDKVLIGLSRIGDSTLPGSLYYSGVGA